MSLPIRSIIDGSNLLSSEETDSSNSSKEDFSPSTSQLSDQAQVIRARKRVRNEQGWVRNKWKKLRNTGKSYVNSKGTAVPPRVSESDCMCLMHCYKKLSYANRCNILDNFNHLQSFGVQNVYLHG